MRTRVGLACVVAAMAAVLLWAPRGEAAGATVWSILPPVLAISLALVLRDVLVSLAAGILVGATMVADGSAVAGFLRFIDTYVRGALTDSDHVSIILFSMLLGGMVGVMSRSGGTHGVVRALKPFATTPRRAQLVTWMMGVAIFFDDYSNTLIVGNTMRPLTDSHRVSREKLAFMVDSTAAPVACIALVSTWVGYQVSLLGDALEAVGSDVNPFSLFLSSIPHAYYPIFALALTFTVAASRRDWGPMLQAERRARGGELLSGTAQPLADYESTGLAPDDETPRRWWNAVIPVVSVVVATLVGLYVTGRQSLQAGGEQAPSLSSIIGAADPFTVLLWASLIGLVSAIALAVGQRSLSLRLSLEAMIAGFKSMLMAVVVLTLAWSLGQVCTDMDTAGFLVAAVGPHLPTVLLPAAVFLVAAAVSFATGTSWGTMAILTPLAVPLVFSAAAGSANLVAATVAAILGGSVFGDHCSPISDTTILSSMASSCDHVDHVRTQLPYALLGGMAAVLVGYVPGAAFGVSPWFLLGFGVIVIVGWTLIVGKPVAECVESELEQQKSP